MKRFLALIISTTCVLFCVACGSNENPKTQNDDSETTGTITEQVQKEEKSTPITVDGSKQARTISAGCCLVAIREDGTVAESGCDICDTSSWTDIVQVDAGGSCVVGLKSDGTVVSTSSHSQGEEVTSWTDIIQVSSGIHHTVGLKSDGTLVATSLESESAVNVGQTDISDWTDIVMISASSDNTVGLKSDGTVVATGVAYKKVENKHDLVNVYFNEEKNTNISDWTDIVAISASSDLTAGLKSDGTVVVAGKIDKLEEVKEWKNIVAISANGYSLMGLKSDGSIVATNMDCSKLGNDFTAFSDGGIGTILQKKDGTVTYWYESGRKTIDKSLFKDIKFKL